MSKLYFFTWRRSGGAVVKQEEEYLAVGAGHNLPFLHHEDVLTRLGTEGFGQAFVIDPGGRKN